MDESPASLNETHEPTLTSWVESANIPETDFPIQNLPFGVFRRAGSSEPYRGGVAIGDQILDLAAAIGAGVFGLPPGAAAAGQIAAASRPAACMAAAEAAAGATLNPLMATGAPAWSALRLALSRALRTGSPQQATLHPCLVSQRQAEFALPAHIGDYTDFYASIHHALRVGRLFRPDHPLPGNYRWAPLGYHGRSSSIGISGQQFPRPLGLALPAGADAPLFGPSRQLDYELELAAFIGPGNTAGSPIPIDAAESHVFGLCLLNDWSARDLQRWEGQPLGPLLSKNFATTLSPWVVTLEAIGPFREPWKRPREDPHPPAYLDSRQVRQRGALDVNLEVRLQTRAMQERAESPVPLSHSHFADSYWCLAQLIAHHSVNGCNLRPGDLLATGTQSGPEPESAGCLLELTQGGRQPLTLPDGETRAFLEDGDTVVMRAWCERPGARRIGFGELRGTVQPARP